MHLSSAIFKRIGCVVLLLVSCSSAIGEETDTLYRRPLDRRAEVGYTGWKRIVPTHVKAQYGGGMGLLSVGGGWDYGRKCRWETDLLIGYLPKRYSDNFHTTLTLKQNYIPWQLHLHDRLSIDPLTGSCYLNSSRARIIGCVNRIATEAPITVSRHACDSISPSDNAPHGI